MTAFRLTSLQLFKVCYDCSYLTYIFKLSQDPVIKDAVFWQRMPLHHKVCAC